MLGINFFVFIIVKELDESGKKGELGDGDVLKLYVGVKDFVVLFFLDWM